MIHKETAKEGKTNLEIKAKYDKFHEIYKNLYGCLKEQYKEIAKL